MDVDELRALLANLPGDATVLVRHTASDGRTTVVEPVMRGETADNRDVILSALTETDLLFMDAFWALCHLEEWAEGDAARHLRTIRSALETGLHQEPRDISEAAAERDLSYLRSLPHGPHSRKNSARDKSRRDQDT